MPQSKNLKNNNYKKKPMIIFILAIFDEEPVKTYVIYKLWLFMVQDTLLIRHGVIHVFCDLSFNVSTALSSHFNVTCENHIHHHIYIEKVPGEADFLYFVCLMLP